MTHRKVKSSRRFEGSSGSPVVGIGAEEERRQRAETNGAVPTSVSQTTIPAAGMSRASTWSTDSQS